MYMLPYSVDGVLVATLPVVMLRTDRGDADLEEFWDVVDQGEDDDGDDEGSARVLSPKTIEQTFYVTGFHQTRDGTVRRTSPNLRTDLL